MTEQNNAAPSDLVEVTSIGQFAAMVAVWHGNIVGQLKQGVDVPDDVEILVGIVGEDGQEQTLTAEQRTGFKAGLLMALSLIEELPFGGIEDPLSLPAGDEEGTGQ